LAGLAARKVGWQFRPDRRDPGRVFHLKSNAGEPASLLSLLWA
jgi:hypothetical protein